MLAVIASGHIELADVFFLVAAIFAGLATVAAAIRGSAETALLPAAVGFIAAALLVL